MEVMEAMLQAVPHSIKIAVVKIGQYRQLGLEKDIQTDNMHVENGQVMGSVAVWTGWSASAQTAVS